MTGRISGTDRDQALQWGSYLGLMDILPGSRLLNVGCGDGGMTRLAAPFVGTRGLALGLDPSASALAEASSRTDHNLGKVVRFVTGAGDRLPFADRMFDAVACVEGLGSAPDPAALLKECRRVCRPSGRVLVVETDWDTQVHQSSLRDLTRRITRAFADSAPAGWGGRQLWGRFNQFAWTNPRLEIYPHFNDEYTPSRTSWSLTQGVMRSAVIASGQVSPEEYERWIADLATQQAGGVYFFSVNRYVCTGRMPPK